MVFLGPSAVTERHHAGVFAGGRLAPSDVSMGLQLELSLEAPA
jgi:hypothetical protein